MTKYIHLPSIVHQYCRHLFSIAGGSISQRRFICQVLVLLVCGGGSFGRRFVCQIGGPLAEEGSSGKSSLLFYWQI